MNRESDLVLFWLLLAAFVVLPSVMIASQEAEPASVPVVGPQRPLGRRERRMGRAGRRERRSRQAGMGFVGEITPLRVIAMSVVSALVIFLGWLTWDKNVDYFWAGTIAASARDRFSEGQFQEAERLMSEAVSKAPDVSHLLSQLGGNLRCLQAVRHQQPGQRTAALRAGFFPGPSGQSLIQRPALLGVRRGGLPYESEWVPEEHHITPGQAGTGQLHPHASVDGVQRRGYRRNQPMSGLLRCRGPSVLYRVDPDDSLVMAPAQCAGYSVPQVGAPGGIAGPPGKVPVHHSGRPPGCPSPISQGVSLPATEEDPRGH